MFEPYLHLLECWHAVPLANCQPKLDRPVNDHLCNFHGLVLRVGGSGDVGELEEFFDGGKYSPDWALRMVCRLLDNVIAFKEFTWNQLTVIFLEVSKNVRHGVIDGIHCAIVDIHEIRLLDCGNNLLHERLINACHFTKKTHFLCV